MKKTIELGNDNILQKNKEDAAKEADNKKKNKNKIIVILLSSIVAIALIATLVITFIVVPTNKYNEAVTLRDSGSWEEAYLLFSKINGYKDSADIIKQMETERPYLSIWLAKNGDIVTLGEYEQDNNTSNGKEPIEWIVLHNEDDGVYLLSKYVLDAQPFNTTAVAECSLNEWLKTTFSKTAFASVGDDVITRVGILPKTDIDNYVITKEQRIAEHTKYALDQYPQYGYTGDLVWWLIESTLHDARGQIIAPVVDSNGSYEINIRDVICRCGVRPAVWLFADPNDLPAEPVFDGSAPTQRYPSSGTKCSSCNGTGKKVVTWYEHGNWGDTSYSSYDCPDCGGDGRK